MIITFFGHSDICGGNRIKELVKNVIRENASTADSIIFYLGGDGDFDDICAQACRELRKEHEPLELVYVSPYMGMSEQTRLRDLQNRGLYDSFIYPPLEKVPYRLAILKRNDWMVLNSDLVIAYVERGCGGAYKAIRYAEKINKRVINVANITFDR